MTTAIRAIATTTGDMAITSTMVMTADGTTAGPIVATESAGQAQTCPPRADGAQPGYPAPVKAVGAACTCRGIAVNDPDTFPVKRR